MASFSSTAFSKQAFSLNAFDFGATPANEVILLGGTPAGPNVNPNAADFYHYETVYQTYQREQEKKQETAISLRIEAQDNLLRQKELKAQHDKQSARQLKALEREQTQLMVNIAAADAEIKKYQLVHKNNMAILALIMACPFFNIGGKIH